MTGRVVRIHPEKSVPIIIDMVDAGCKRMRSTFFTRKKFYEKKNWIIQYIAFNNGQATPIDEDLAMKIISGNQQEKL
jgi:hypothetical protein